MLILSLFPGIGLLDMAFESEGFCVVRGPDSLWGGDIRRFRPPAGVFDGVIGGPPCQQFSCAATKGSRAADLIPEFERCVGAARPRWFVMENTRRAPLPSVPGFRVWSNLFDNRHFGSTQKRQRRISFGTADGTPLRVQPALFVDDGVIHRAVLASDGRRNGRGQGSHGRRDTLAGQVHTFAQACELQGLPRDFLRESPFTNEGRWRVIGNGVPLALGRAVARAVRETLTN